MKKILGRIPRIIIKSKEGVIGKKEKVLNS